MVKEVYKQVEKLTEEELLKQYPKLVGEAGATNQAAREAWYIGKSQELLKDVGIPIYGATDFGTVEKAYEAAQLAAQEGKPLYNLTLALNDKVLVRTESTQRAVYKLLLQKKGNKAAMEKTLEEIGRLFQKGKVPVAP